MVLSQPTGSEKGANIVMESIALKTTLGQDQSDPGRDITRVIPPGGRGGHPSPAPTERSVQFYRTTLFRSWFTALWLELAAPHKGDAAWVAAKGTVP